MMNFKQRLSYIALGGVLVILSSVITSQAIPLHYHTQA